jgi:hypothetical protein
MYEWAVRNMVKISDRPSNDNVYEVGLCQIAGNEFPHTKLGGGHLSNPPPLFLED